MRTAFVIAASCAILACGSDASTAQAPGRQESGAALEMRVARATHAAVKLPDSRVLLIGGCVGESCDEGPDSATVDVFDPRSGGVALAGRLLAPRVSPTVASLPSGEVLIAGGWSGGRVSAKIEAYDPASGQSQPLPPLSLPRSDIAVAALGDGRVLLAGGYDGTGATDLVEVYDPSDRTVSTVGRLRIPRADASATLLADGKVLVAGGGSQSMVPTASAEVFDPATGKSSPAGAMSRARYKHAAIALADGRVAVIGGSDQRDSAGKWTSIDMFDPAKGRFTPGGTMREARYKIARTVVRLTDGRLVIAGGANRAELFDPATGRSKLFGPNLGAALNFATATLLDDGRLLIAGGYDERGIRMSRKAWIVDLPRRGESQ